MRTLTRLDRLRHANIRRWLSGILVTVCLVHLLVQSFGIPCGKGFCFSTLKVATSDSLTISSELYVVKNKDDGKKNSSLDIDRETNVEVNVIARTNISFEKTENTNSVLIKGKASRESNVLSKRHSRRAGVSISQMNSLLIQSLSSIHSPKPRWSSARDSEMLSAKSEIEVASVVHQRLGFNALMYRNFSKFQRSYELMEKKLKVYVYKEGEKPIFHNPKPRGIYASEGWFMKLMERNNKFIVKDPRKAHFFYIPISIRALRYSLGPDFKTPRSLEDHFNKYVDLIARKYKFWNRTSGADHFLVACHDWGNKLTKQQMNNSVRSLCNSNVAQGFRIGTDTALPVTYIRSAESPCEYRGGKNASERNILAFFAGSMHGYLRPILVKLWENKESDMKIFGPMPRDPESKKKYREYMKSSRYCICARGYEVHTPRVVEAIINECVPVIIADNYVPPFFDVLNWEEFAVFVEEKDLPYLRNTLLSIPDERYIELHANVKMVQQHFLWHKKPEKLDLFHMILHSIWYNRVHSVRTR